MYAIAAGVLFASVALAGCSDIDGLPTARTFDNRTGMDITVVWQRQSGERMTQAAIPDGEKATIGMNQFGNPTTVCGDGTLVILGPSGEELIQRPASCVPWIIRLPAVPRAEITDRTWVLTGLVKPGRPSTKPAQPASIVLDADGGLTVETGCRTLTGHWTTSADEISPTDLLVAKGTKSGDCPAPLVDQDDQISRVVGSGFAVHVDGHTLTATSNDGPYLDWQLAFADDPTDP